MAEFVPKIGMRLREPDVTGYAIIRSIHPTNDKKFQVDWYSEDGIFMHKGETWWQPNNEWEVIDD